MPGHYQNHTSSRWADTDGDLNMFKKTLALMLAAAFLVAITGCNTLHGAGQDIEAVGEGLQDATSE